VIATNQRVFLHVGTPKSGTTFLQRALWKNHDELRAAGVTCPGTRSQDMFHAAIEIREVFDGWGYDRDALTGTWARLCGDVRAFPGTSVMSHELLSAGSPEQVARARSGLDGLETHVVLTVRDLSRQVTSEWQERIKNGSTSPFRRFQRRIERQMDREDFSASFWRFQHVTGILDRWAADLPPERVHVVVAPRGQATPDVLWRRFGEAVGFDGAQFDPITTGGLTNQTLGTTQVAVLRRVNKALAGRVRQPHYARVVKDYFAQHLLASQPGTKPTCPPDLVDRLRGFAQAQNDEITTRGYRVYGDLADLVPEPATALVPAPDEVDPDELLEASVQAIADLLADRAARRAGRVATPSPVADDADAPASWGTRVRRRLRRTRG
jgi:hypothetical protein